MILALIILLTLLTIILVFHRCDNGVARFVVFFCVILLQTIVVTLLVTVTIGRPLP